jgi:predicted DNA-binding transcriptional regulator YafY
MTVPARWPGGPQLSVDPGLLTSVALACRDDERIRFCYTAADGRRSDRQVEPHRLVWLGGRWYLVGYDLDRHDWRSYRLDRASGLRGTGARFAPRQLPAADAAAFVRAGIDTARAVYEAEALVDAPAAAVRERIGRWSAVEDTGSGRCRIRMTADSLDWVVIALGTVGADFEVVSPPELLDLVRDWGRRFSRAALAVPNEI